MFDGTVPKMKKVFEILCVLWTYVAQCILASVSAFIDVFAILFDLLML